MKANEIIEAIEKKSVRPIENKPLLERYVSESLLKKRAITFYNWECPPRKLSFDRRGKMIMDYEVDYDKIFAGKKIDRFSEIPRVVAERKRENEQLRFLVRSKLKFRFVKIIADTNAYYLTPESLGRMKDGEIGKIFDVFKKKIKAVLDDSYEVDTEVLFFSELMSIYRNIYESSFRLVANSEWRLFSNIIPDSIWRGELQRLKTHVGFPSKMGGELEKFAKRVIATYGAEGLVFAKLAKTEAFSNCVWLNNEEAEDSAIAATNCLRTRKRIGKLPMIFLR